MESSSILGTSYYKRVESKRPPILPLILPTKTQVAASEKSGVLYCTLDRKKVKTLLLKTFNDRDNMALR